VTGDLGAQPAVVGERANIDVIAAMLRAPRRVPRRRTGGRSHPPPDAKLKAIGS